MYRIISQDIVKFDGDAIINSLGQGPAKVVDDPGRIFRSILAVAGKGLAEEVYEKGKDLSFGKSFVTDSYGLPCKKIVHIVTPYRHEDDEMCSDLREAYDDALSLAYEEGIRSIAVPMIGTGANGYSQNESFYASRMAAYDFCLKHKDFDASIVIYRVPINPRSLMDRPRRLESPQPNWDSAIGRLYYGNGNPQERYTRNRYYDAEPSYIPRIGEKIPTQLIDMSVLDVKVGDSFGRVIDLFLAARDGVDPNVEKNFDEAWKAIASCLNTADVKYYHAGHKYKESSYNYRYYWHKHADAKHGIQKTPGVKRGAEDPNGVFNTPDKKELMLVACALQMNKKQCDFLMRFCGYYLSQYRHEDIAVKHCYQCLATKDQESNILAVYTIYDTVLTSFWN